MNRWGLSAFVLIATILLAAPASAGCGVACGLSNFGWGGEERVTGALPSSTFELNVELAEFQMLGAHGHYQAISPSIEYALHPKLSLAARFPVARIDYIGGDQTLGVADASVGTKVALYDKKGSPLALSAGVSLEFPTGDTDMLLGAGHVGLMTFAAYSFVLHPRAVIYGSVLDRFSFGETSNIVHGSMLSPHGAHEVAAQLNVGTNWRKLFGAVGAEAIYGVSGPTGMGPWSLRGEVGYRLPGPWRLAAGVDLPVTGDQRFEWRGRVGLVWILPLGPAIGG